MLQFERIVGLVAERYPHADMNEIKKRMNQKCRDARPKPGTQSQQPEGDGDDNQNGVNGPDHCHHIHEEDDT